MDKFYVRDHQVCKLKLLIWRIFFNKNYDLLVETGSFVTQIKLEHTLFTEVSTGHPVSGFDNYIYPQDPFVIYNNQDNYYSQTNYQRPTAPQQPQPQSYPSQPQYTTTPPYQPQPQPVYPTQTEQQTNPFQTPPPQQSTADT